MAIRWDQLGKQLVDWGGDYDVLDNRSYDGGARDAATPNKKGTIDQYYNTQGKTKPGYDATGRKVAVANTPNPNPEPRVDNSTSDGGGNGSGYAAGYDPVAVQAARKAAEDNAKKARLKGEGIASLDELYALYDQIVNQIKTVGGDQIGRINKDFDGKVQDQVTDMNNGMYDTDAAAAANNLADSSFRSFDRGKVRTAADANIKTLNGARESSAAEVGTMVANDTAKYRADQAGIGRSKQLLNESDDLGEIQSTANTVDATKRGARADTAKYSTTGEFAQKANSIGKYDTSVLESTLASVVANASASPAAKAGAVNDLLTGAQIDDSEKERLKNKYTQSV